MNARHLMAKIIILLGGLITPVCAQLDLNSNGMSDVWERFYNNGELFDSENPDHHPDADPDGDGWTNLQESIAGTNPFSANPPEGFIPTYITYLENQEMPDPDDQSETIITDVAIISWDTIPGKTYTLWASPDLTPDSWIIADGPIMGDGIPWASPILLGHLSEDEPERLFWRVKIEDPHIDSDGDGLTDYEEYLLGSNPFNPDTSGDGVPDGWLVAHGLNPLDNHSGITFPGFPSITISMAHAMGVAANPNATPDDLDGDGIPNDFDVDPYNATLKWPRGPSAAWMVRYPDIEGPSDALFLDVSTTGTVMYRSNEKQYIINRNFIVHTFDTVPSPQQIGFRVSPFSSLLHGDRVFGEYLVSLEPWNQTGAYFDPESNSVAFYAIPPNNPPEVVFDATNLHVSGVGGGFGFQLDGQTPLFNGNPGYFQSNENAVSVTPGFVNQLTYWTFDGQSYDQGRPIMNSSPFGFGNAHFTATHSATVVLRDHNNVETVHHMVPTPAMLHVAEGAGAFGSTEFPAPIHVVSATKEGWFIDSYSNRLWQNGRWRPLNHYLPIRTTDNAPMEILQIHKVRDTGVMAATVRHQGDIDWKHAVLTPMHLHIHHPSENLTIPWNDYLPGYVLDNPVLCAGNTFETLQFNGPQEIHLRLSGPAVDLADAATLTINHVTNHAGWAVNAGDSTENDFSFSPNSCLNTKNVDVVDGVATIPMYCKDYAAWAEIRITLTKNNTPIHPEPITVTLPHDTTGDRIADQWQYAEVLRWNAQFRLSPGDQHWIAPSDPTTWSAIFGSNGQADAELADSDGPNGPMPPMADDGDGLTAFEEYRGFFLDGGPNLTTPRHRRLSVARKEALFAFLVLAEIQDTSNPGNRANTAAANFDPMVPWHGVMNFFQKPFAQGGADLDCYMVHLPMIVDENLTVPTPNGGTRSAYLPDTDLRPIANSTRPGKARTYVYLDRWLLDEEPAEHAEVYAATEQTARQEAFKRAHQGTESRGGYGMLDKFTTATFYNRFGSYLQNPHWSLGVNEYIPTSFSHHLHGGTASQPMIDPSPKHRGIQFAINSISEDKNTVPSIHDFNNRLEWAIAHEIGHALIWARHAGHPAPEPGLVSDWFPPDTISLGPVSMQAEEIQLIDMRNRLSTKK